MAAGSGIRHSGMVPAKQAIELVLAGAGPSEAETVPLKAAHGRVLADDLISLRTQPPFPASAMDGYAVNHAGMIEAKHVLEMIGEAAAGHPFGGWMEPNQCIRIFTGAPVPDGADTIVIQENATQDGNRITVETPPAPGKFVRPAGLDFREGDMLLPKDTVIDPQRLALAASMNYSTVPVYRRPIVAVLSTGDELVLPGEETGPGQIIASNTFGVAAIAESAGANILNLGIARDTIEHLSACFNNALENGADLIVTTGGASVGDHDLVKPVMESLGFEFIFIKVAMRPGKPVLFAERKTGDKTVRLLGLPGNPVSSLVCSHIFLKPLIRLLGGYPAETIKPVKARLTASLPANDERQDHLRAIGERTEAGELTVHAFNRQDSSMLATLSNANCLLIRPVNAPAASEGETVDIILLRDL
jgi:molybdopterin molybdotransferase